MPDGSGVITGVVNPNIRSCHCKGEKASQLLPKHSPIESWGIPLVPSKPDVKTHWGTDGYPGRVLRAAGA